MQTQTPPLIDSLQIKIEKAKANLPALTQQAIDSIDWRAVILGMREKKGYSYEQLEDLELETELLLCGMTNPENFPKELMERMKLPKAEIDMLINELNETIFKKIRDKLMGTSSSSGRIEEGQTPFPLGRAGDGLEILHPDASVTPQEGNKLKDLEVLNNAGIEMIVEKKIPEENTLNLNKDQMLKEVENPSLIKTNPTPSISMPMQKLSGSFQIPTVKTEYTLPSLGKDKIIPVSSGTTKIPNTDPYREMPE